MSSKDDFRSVLVPDPTGPGMYRIAEEYVGPLPPAPPLRMRRSTRQPTRGRASTTPEDRIRAQFRAHRRSRHWWHDGGGTAGLLMSLARQWKRPIREIKRIVGRANQAERNQT